MKKITFIVISILCTMSLVSQTTYSWRDEAGNGNWNESANWWDGSFPNTPAGGEIIRFNNNVELSMTNNLVATNRHQIFFDSNATATRTISGITENSFFDFSGAKPKIENQSSVNHSIGFPIKLGYNPLELNPVNGDLTFTGNIDTNGNYIDVFGNNGHNLNISGIISGSGGITLQQNSTIIFTSDNTYSGSTTLQAGTLKLQGDLEFSDVQVFNGTLEIDGDVTLKSLSVNTGGSVTINPGKSLTVLGVVNNLGSATLESSSALYSSLIVKGSFVGQVIYNRHVNIAGTGAGGGNDLISTPVSGQKWSTFLGDNQSIIKDNGATNPTTYAFGPFDNTADPAAYITYTDDESPSTDVLSGVGYRAATEGPDQNLIFTGTVLTGDFSGVAISNFGTTSRWNLIGNPYPSYLDAQAFLTENAGIIDNTILDPNYSAIYGYNDSTDGTSGGSIWTIINNIQNTSTNIAPGQGFFVASNNTTGSDNVQFKTASPDMRTAVGTDDFIQGRSSQDEANSHLKLTLTNNTKTYRTDFYFNDNSSLGLDPGYDAGSFDAGNSEFSLYSHLVADNAGIDMAIQSLGSLDMNDAVIPLGINAGQGQQLTVSIAINELPEGINVYLEDNNANIWTLLNTSDYVFTPSVTLSGTGRFFLHFTTATLSAEDTALNGFQVYSDFSSRTINIKGQLAYDTKVNIYDMQGRKVLNRSMDNSSTTNIINVSTLSAGIYIVELQNGKHNKTQKVILK